VSAPRTSLVAHAAVHQTGALTRCTRCRSYRKTTPGRNGSTTHGGLEPPGLGNGPGGHVPTIAGPVNAQPLTIDVRTLERRIDHSHQIQIIFATPILPDVTRERSPVGHRPTRIAEHHQEPLSSKQLLDGIEVVAVETLWTAMHVQDHRILASGVEVERLQQPRLNREPARCTSNCSQSAAGYVSSKSRL
jgi:hypothetical protein